jgi:hypothetical protein
MADFTPKKVSSEKGTAKGSLAHDNTSEHQAPPRIYLEHHHLEKLGMTKMPPVGSKIKISGLAHVGATSENASDGPSGGKAPGGEGNTRRSMTLHLHKMEMGKDGVSDGEKEESQKDGMKGAIDKALTKAAGSEASKGKAMGKTPTPRAGGD